MILRCFPKITRKSQDLYMYLHLADERSLCYVSRNPPGVKLLRIYFTISYHS